MVNSETNTNSLRLRLQHPTLTSVKSAESKLTLVKTAESKLTMVESGIKTNFLQLTLHSSDLFRLTLRIPDSLGLSDGVGDEEHFGRLDAIRRDH